MYQVRVHTRTSPVARGSQAMQLWDLITG